MEVQSEPVRDSHGFPLRVAVATDVGQVRLNNEDASKVAWIGDGSLLVVVADGMGGHQAGEVASQLAVDVIAEAMAEDPEDDPRSRLDQAMLRANDAIIGEAKIRKTRGMGTTAIAILCQGPRVFAAYIGDSRLYWIRRGKVLWRTLDHTRVQALVDLGEVRESEAREHSEAGMLTRALGHARMIDGRALVPDVAADPLQLEPGDAMVISTDGLHDLLTDDEIADLVAGEDPERAASAIVGAALDRGGHDNVTVAVVTAAERAAPLDRSFVPPRVPRMRLFVPGGPLASAPGAPPAPAGEGASALGAERPASAAIPIVTLFEIPRADSTPEPSARNVSPSWDPRWRLPEPGVGEATPQRARSVVPLVALGLVLAFGVGAVGLTVMVALVAWYWLS